MQHVNEAADARQGAAHQVGQELGLADVDAQHIGAVGVAAHGVEAAAQLGPFQHHKEQHHNDQGHDDTGLHIGCDELALLGGVADALEEDVVVLGGHKLLVGDVDGVGIDDGGHALGEEHPCQGHDEGLDVQIGHQIPLHQAEGHADAQGDEGRGNNISPHYI